jgi:hypothetical protein
MWALSSFSFNPFFQSSNFKIHKHDLPEVINEITKNNFPFWLHIQILLDFKLENLEIIQIWILLEF